MNKIEVLRQKLAKIEVLSCFIK
uniref:Uncharacterized protein n=1 Tax=Anguilla anguilla TaxID=7936 RepID=A0A0E9PS17_ANGAN